VKAQKFMPLLVVAAGLLAYHNSFTGPFLFDDLRSIPENQTIRHLWPIWQPLSPPHRTSVDGRPLIKLSLAVNYAIGGTAVQGYHALNLIIHILAGLTLFGIVRRTLLQPKLRERFGAVADKLALAVAVLWTVHPLLTESVTYVIQRTESLMGLFYLLTLYCFIRAAESPRPRVWYGLCVTACALGMASKEVMVSAPLMVLLYDWVFLAPSFRELWRRRIALYLGLAATWLILASSLVGTFRPVVGFEILSLTPWDYLKTEAGVIVYYLRLCFWPYPLVIDYSDWPIARSLNDILVPGIVVVGLLSATIWSFRRRPWLAFLGAWFFLILAPTSSFLPILGEVIAERRMYLPLVAVTTMVVIGIHSWAGRRSLPVFIALAVGLGFLTVHRNEDYRSEITIWSDAVTKRPGNSQAEDHLGITLGEAGRIEEAIGHYENAVRINPNYAEAQNNLGNALTRTGKIPEAIEHLERAVRVAPDFPEAEYNLGVALAQEGKFSEAINHLEHSLRIQPDNAEGCCNLGVVLAQADRIPEAIKYFEQALQINPNFAQAHYNLGMALGQTGRISEAKEHLEEALRVQPNFTPAQSALARLQAVH
jgi:protein O-mannosyl-transferase